MNTAKYMNSSAVLMQSNFAKLPKYCYSHHPVTKEPIRLFRGEDGYYPPLRANVSVNEINGLIGVTAEQEEAMLYGSMFGWNTLAANPDTWLNDPLFQAKCIENGRKAGGK